MIGLAASLALAWLAGLVAWMVDQARRETEREQVDRAERERARRVERARRLRIVERRERL